MYEQNRDRSCNFVTAQTRPNRRTAAGKGAARQRGSTLAAPEKHGKLRLSVD